MAALYTATVFLGKTFYTDADVPTQGTLSEDIPMGYSDNISLFRKRAKLTQAQLAEKLGVEQPTVQRWEAGTREPSLEMLSLLGEVFDVNPAMIIDVDAFRALGPTLYIKGEVAAGQWVEAFEWPQDDWKTFAGRGDVAADMEHRFGLRVKGDSMNLRYPEGSIVECVSLFGRAEAIPGKRVVVIRQRRSDHLYEATVKLLKMQDGELWLAPESSNPAHQAFRLDCEDPDIIETRIAAVVVAATVREE